MNTSKRFLILDSHNQPMAPGKMGYSGPDLQSEGSPSFTKEASALKFGSWLAKRHVGQRFYLAVITAGTVAYTEPDANPSEWVATV